MAVNLRENMGRYGEGKRREKSCNETLVKIFSKETKGHRHRWDTQLHPWSLVRVCLVPLGTVWRSPSPHLARATSRRGLQKSYLPLTVTNA